MPKTSHTNSTRMAISGSALASIQVNNHSPSPHPPRLSTPSPPAIFNSSQSLPIVSFNHPSISSSNFPGRRRKFAGQSVKAFPIRIITVGKKRSVGVQLLVDEYVGKLKNYCSVDDVQVRSNPRNARDARAQVDDEDMTVMNLISSDDWVVLLDESGLDIGSEQMAELIAGAGDTGASRLSFCIGGPYGHGQQVMDYSKRTKVSPLAIF